MARLAGGLTRRAIDYARKPDLLRWREATQRELLGLIASGSAERFDSVRHLLDTAARVEAAPAVEEVEPVDDEAPRLAGAAQRGAALLVIDAWRDLARDLLMAAAGRPQLVSATTDREQIESVGRSVDRGELIAFLALAGRITDGLRENAAPRLALEIAMLAWPRTGAAARAAS